MFLYVSYGYTMEGDWFDLVYFMTWTRCPVYFMGIMLGYFFVKTGGKFKMPWVSTTMSVMLLIYHNFIMKFSHINR